MEKLAIQLALNGAVVLTASMLGGMFLYKAILNGGNETDWHLLHAGGSVRGVMLLALAATIHLPALPAWQLWVAAWLIIFFTWTSMLAMIMRAVTSERGFGFTGSTTNKIIFVLYALGTIAVFTGFLWLIFGLVFAL
jgi:hypothetical protein